MRICQESGQALDLLLTDVVMPDLNGAELAERVQPIRPEMKVLYMSGYADGGLLEDLRRRGGALLAKPFTPEVMLWRVRQELGPAGSRGSSVTGDQAPSSSRRAEER